MAPLLQEYLVHSPGFVGQFLCRLTLMLLFVYCVSLSQELVLLAHQAYDLVNNLLMEGAYSMMWWSVLAMLSSACCALQLFLNSLSIGCAGFNTSLGPHRPTFLAATAMLQILAWKLALSRPYQWKPLLVSSSVTWILSLLPEILALRLKLMSKSIKPTDSDFRSLFLSVESLGCIACATTTARALCQLPIVESCAPILSKKLIKVTLTASASAALAAERSDKLTAKPYAKTRPMTRSLARALRAGQKVDSLKKNSSKKIVVTLCRTLEEVGFPAKLF